MSIDPKLRLYTFRLSHFSEKIRWALDRSALAYEEIAWTPFFHIFPAIFRGGRTTVPILEADGERVQDSTRIFHWLEQHRPSFRMIPPATDAAARDEALAIERRFDHVGEHVVRYVYSETLADRESVSRYWTIDATPRQARGIRRDFPVLRWIFRRKLSMNAKNVARSKAVIAESLDWLETELAKGRTYLVGDRLTVADVTAAALLAPLACPEEHGIYGSARYRQGVEAVVGAWRDRPAFVWVRDMYRRERGTWPEFERVRAAVG